MRFLNRQGFCQFVDWRQSDGTLFFINDVYNKLTEIVKYGIEKYENINFMR